MQSEWRKPRDANSAFTITWDGTLEETPTKMNRSISPVASVTNIVLSTRRLAPRTQTPSPKRTKLPAIEQALF